MTPPPVPPPFDDVRMRGFRTRTEVAAVVALLDARTAPLPGEPVALAAAAGRVLATAVVAAADVPGFERAAMDGFAVRAADTTAADAARPVVLELVGVALPGRPFAGMVGTGRAVRVTTGAPLPAGADAVVVAEVAAEIAGGRVAVRAAVAAGKHVGRVGEDVAKGRAILPAGRVLRPQDVGLIAAVGVGVIAAVRRPRVALLVTGEELLPPGTMPTGYRIVDSNSPMLAALIARDGGIPFPVRYLPDHYESVRDAIRDAAADVLLVSGGTSVGAEDHAPRVLAEVGELAVHGIAVRPAGPTGVGFVVKGRTGEAEGPAVPPLHPFTPSPAHVFLLPGNPVACLCAYDLFAGRVVRRLGGRAWGLPYRRATLPLAAGLASAVGRVDYVRVRVEGGQVYPVAGGGASNLSSAVVADGFVLIDHARAALAAGEMVEVHLYDAA